KRVRVAKRSRELIHQIASARKAVRLKDHMHPPIRALPSRRQRSSYLRRMMPVIVNHADAGGRSFKLKAPVHAAKSRQRRTNLLRRNIERRPYRNRRRSIPHVVHTRHVQRELAEILLLISHLKANQRPVLFGSLRQSNWGGPN